VINQFQYLAERKSIPIIEKIPPELIDLMIQTDSLKLHQILTNLLGNALKFTTEGFIEMGLEKHPDGVLFFIRDTGIGISAEQMDRVFDRFYQVDSTYTRRFEGAGIGLSLCKGMVELLGGKIRVESEVGKGSKFAFILPEAPR